MIIEGCFFLDGSSSVNGDFVSNETIVSKKLRFANVSLKSFNKDLSETFHLVINDKICCVELKNTTSAKVTDFISPELFDSTLMCENAPEIAFRYDDQTLDITLVRNIFGKVPVYYIHIPLNFFAFSTDLSSLVRMKEVKGYLNFNNLWIARYLSLENGDSYSKETIYQYIKKLLPGHKLEISRKIFKEEPFYKFQAGKWDHLRTVSEYGDVFLDLLKKSVGRELLSKTTIGAQLSGGIDSSSICVIAKHINPDLNIKTVFIDVPLDKSEQHFALDVVKQINSEHHIITPSTNDLEVLILHTSLYASPEEMISGSVLTSDFLNFSKENGISTMLSGHDGDGIVGHGIEYPEILFKESKWNELKTLFSISSQVYPHYNIDPDWDSLSQIERDQAYTRNFLLNQLKISAKLSSFRLLIYQSHKIAKHFGISTISRILLKLSKLFFKKVWRRTLYPTSILSANFAQGIQSPDPTEKLSNVMSKGLKNIDFVTFHDIYGGASINVMENLFSLRKHYGIADKFPFYDKDLFELGMSIPLSLKFDHGKLRGYLREGMKNILPESVRTRGDKGKFSLYGREVAIRLHAQAQTFLTPSSEIWRYVDKKKFERVVDILHKENTPGLATFYVLRVISFAVWLQWARANNLSNQCQVTA